MRLEYYIIIILIVAIILLFSIYRKYRRNLAFQKSDYENQLNARNEEYCNILNNQHYDYENKLNNRHFEYEKKLEKQKSEAEEHNNKIRKEAEEYKNQTRDNIKKTIPYGERLIIKKFQEFFENSLFKEFTIYSHLEFENNGGYKQTDFLIVSPKGLFVLESKNWKGITYIYSQNFNHLFKTTKYNYFGIGSNLDITVFNAQTNEKGEIILSEYQHPIAQVREYSSCLVDILSTNQIIKNVVVFNSRADGEIMYDNMPLKNTKVLDIFTALMSDMCLEDYFSKLPNLSCEMKPIIEFIDHNLSYLFKMDCNNYNQAPFDLIKEWIPVQ